MVLSRPRVLIVIDTATVGGPGKGILQLMRRLSPEQAALAVATFQSARHRSSEFLQRLRAERRTAVVLQERVRFDPRPVARAEEAVRELGINVLQSHGYKGHLLAALLSRRLGIPWVAVMNGYTREDIKVRLYHALDGFSLRYANMIVAVSTELCERAVEICGNRRKVHFIANAIDADDLQDHGGAAALSSRLAPSGEIVIGVFGRLSPEKGQALLLDAYAAVRQQLPPSRLLVVGDGVLRAPLEAQAGRLGLADAVVFEGYQSGMRDYFGAVDLLALPSYREGLPNVVLEAFQYGVPVLSAAVGAVPSLVEDGESGWLFPAGDEQALRERLVRALVTDRPRWLAITQHARSSLYPRFCPKERAKRFLSLYQELLENGRAAWRRPAHEAA